MACDNLISADVVTADGRLITADAGEHHDLHWALRGGGGSFGIVTSFEYQLHPIGPMITGGLLAYPLTAAADLLRFYREFTIDAPDELGLVCGVVHAPDGSGVKLAALVVCHCGDDAQAQRDLRPALEFGEP